MSRRAASALGRPAGRYYIAAAEFTVTAPIWKEHPRMVKQRPEPRRSQAPTPFDQARDELFSHILRCGVLEATPEHQKEWFDDTIPYLGDRYGGLDPDQLAELRLLGERYCRPVVARPAPVGATS